MEMLKKFFEPVDMTEGAPWKKIVFFTVPMLVGNIAQQLYNTVDSVVVGNYVGDPVRGRCDKQGMDRWFRILLL